MTMTYDNMEIKKTHTIAREKSWDTRREWEGKNESILCSNIIRVHTNIHHQSPL